MTGKHERIQFVLFALTGLGNIVLERLIKSGHAPDLVVTRSERKPYPYEPIPFIGEVAAGAGITCMIDVDGELQVVERGAEILLLATYHRRVGGNVIRKCEVAINLHPSILPHNRGANPFFWSIRNGDGETGVTAHLLSGELDGGDICMQQRVSICTDETQSTLRRKLGHVAGEMAVDVVRAYADKSLQFSPQSEEAATSHPRVNDRQRQLDLADSGASVIRHVNALRDWPCALLGDRRVLRVLSVAPQSVDAGSTTILAADDATCRVRVADADLVLQLD